MTKQEMGGSPATTRILASALASFAEKGYHGTTTRDLAAGADLSVPGVYHHFGSKQDVLMALMVEIMGDLLVRTRTALATAKSASPIEQFDALARALLQFHFERPAEAFVASSEIRSLTPENRHRYVALRDLQQQMLTDVIVAGKAAGHFEVDDVADAARAVATLCVGVATWYRPDGSGSLAVLLERQLVLTRRLVGA